MSDLRKKLEDKIVELISIPRGKTISQGMYVDSILTIIEEELPEGKSRKDVETPAGKDGTHYDPSEVTYILGYNAAIYDVKQLLQDAKNHDKERV